MPRDGFRKILKKNTKWHVMVNSLFCQLYGNQDKCSYSSLARIVDID